ncbi:flagellar FliL protein [Modicisalibacter muralis]|uniref:Flagellar protein FliL n=1 Tax=Modicisalibacter muralis TaxID=119000 RepID=A0A1G9FUI5_9GAMM|nr:flagellar basal body-associated protein FliL [Halomonas muralis]SDK92096.1 flagellar FliL protein [Halomonas muralis]
MASNQIAGKSRKPWWLLGILIIMLSMACSAVVFFMLDSKSSAVAQDSQVSSAPVEAPAPIFVGISPFTVNLQSEEYAQRLLYIGLSLKVADEATQQLIMEHMPQVRSRLLMLLSSQSAEDLISPQGKQALSKEILALFDEPFSDPQPPLRIQNVLYTDFIVQ